VRAVALRAKAEADSPEGMANQKYKDKSKDKGKVLRMKDAGYSGTECID
jgi:hypothetical protein